MSRVTALAWVISITLATVVGAESASQSWRAAWNVTRAYLEGPDYLRPPRHYKTLKMMLAEAGLAPPPRVSASRALTGTREILVILVRLTDATPNPSHTTAYYHDRFFATSPPSVSDYYDEVSYGNFTFVPGAVLGWYPSGYDRYQWAYVDPSPVVVEAIQDVDADFDFAPYDTDSDGTVTNEELSIFIIVSGTTGGASHWWTNTPVVTADGVTVEGEFSGAHEDRHIGSYAHELGHDLGLPDLYDTDTGLTGDSEGIGRYGLMGGGSWTFSHLSAWSKIQLGWITPTILFTSAYHDVRDAETNAEAYVLVDYSHSTEEYFLVENRYPRNSYYETVGPPVAPSGVYPDSGIVIYHIDDAKAKDWIHFGINDVNADETHKAVDVETPEHPSSHAVDADDLDATVNKGDENDLWDIGAYDFTDTSTPCNANWYGGIPSHMQVLDFPVAGPTMTVYLGTWGSPTAVGDESHVTEKSVWIRSSPNPFNPQTTITYHVPEVGHVEVTIYDITGRQVVVLIDEEMSEGEHHVFWSGRDAQGTVVATGVYILRLTFNGEVRSEKLTLLK